MLTKIVGRNSSYCMKNVLNNDCHKNQTVIQIKETLSSLPANIKLHFINSFGDNLSDNIDSCIEVIHCTLIFPILS